MSVDVIKDMGHSVNARLKSLAGQRRVSFDYLLLRYAYERFLFRLGRSQQSSRFILKGACAFSVWFGPMFRVTRDTDFLCHGNPAPEQLAQCFRDICATEVLNDGVRFDTDSIVTSEIKKDARYRGTRVVFNARIQNARVTLQFDVGFGDCVYPDAVIEEYPRLLDSFPSPCILVYPRCTVVAEKFEAIVSLGMLNSRVKDYFDIWLLSENFDFDYPVLSQAIEGTFMRRGSDLPDGLPIGLTKEYSQDAMKLSQWSAFIRKVSPLRKPASLQECVERMASFRHPFLCVGEAAPVKWEAGKRWQ